jgi:peptidoglycan/xylan/chitin deacetylase (PgdA/CDA1 family)
LPAGAAAFYDPGVMLGRAPAVLVSLAAFATGVFIGLPAAPREAIRNVAARAVATVRGTSTARNDDFAPPPVDVAPPLVVGDAPVLAPAPGVDPPALNPDETIARAWLLAEGPYHPPGDNHDYVTFTFDDGPFPETTPQVLDLLDRYGVHATFFLIGRYLDGDDARSELARGVVRRMVASGHLVGNHTYDHRHLTELARPAALAQIDMASDAIFRVSGQMPTYFRPPFGDLSHYLERTFAERKTDVTLWSLEAEDMERSDDHAVAHEIRLRMEYAHGGVVLLHDCRESSVEALERLLRWLDDNKWDSTHPEQRGFEIVDLPTYTRLTAASPQPYPTRDALLKARAVEWKASHPEVAPPPPLSNEAPRGADL